VHSHGKVGLGQQIRTGRGPVTRIMEVQCKSMNRASFTLFRTLCSGEVYTERGYGRGEVLVSKIQLQQLQQNWGDFTHGNYNTREETIIMSISPNIYVAYTTNPVVATSFTVSVKGGGTVA
jgi:hypothetical protein